MINRSPIATIHKVPIYGRIPLRFQDDTIQNIEQATTFEDWDGIQYIVVSDEDVSLSKEQNEIDAASYLADIEDWDLPVIYQDGSKEIFSIPKDKPIIKLKAGFFQDPYWLAFTLLHELGHHHDLWDPNRKSVNFNKVKEIRENPVKSKNAEVQSHLFALTRVNESSFQFNTEHEPSYFDEALDIFNKRNFKKS